MRLWSLMFSVPRSASVGVWFLSLSRTVSLTSHLWVISRSLCAGSSCETHLKTLHFGSREKGSLSPIFNVHDSGALICRDAHIVMSIREESAAALIELHRRLKSLVDTFHGSVKVTHVQHKWSPEGWTRSTTLKCFSVKGLQWYSDFWWEYAIYEDWMCKVRIFLNPEYFIFTQLLTFLDV